MSKDSTENPAELTPRELDKAACEAVGLPAGTRTDGGVSYAVPPVSTDPAACARLKAAASEAGLPMLLIFHGETVLAMLCDAVTEHDGTDALGMKDAAELELIATAETWARAETEERAVALAVAEWGAANG